MNRLPKILFRGIGVISVLCALTGLIYNTGTIWGCLAGAFTPVVNAHDERYFYPAFYVMSAICIFCYLALLYFGFRFLLLKRGHVFWFTGLVLFEAAYFFCIGLSWLLPNFGMSIGAATGVAYGGLMAQFIILFPLWGPVAGFWANRKLEPQS